MDRRFLIFAGITIIALALVFDPLHRLQESAGRSEYYSHIVLIPLVTGYLIYLKRKRLLEKFSHSFGTGAILAVGGIALYLLGLAQGEKLSLNDRAAILVLSAIIFWVGGFMVLYGWDAFRRAPFPFLFLVFLIPIPDFLMKKIIHALQAGSIEVSEILFTLSGVPFEREGFFFQLPGVSIEVAEQCSGIRSSLALLITSILAGHFFLDRVWKKVFLALLVFPITVFKNGLRIMILSLLGAYVDVGFLTGGFIHKSGGFLFFIPALGLLGLALWALRTKGEGARFSP
jgi:exosortase